MSGAIGNLLERIGRFVRRSELDGFDPVQKEALAQDVGVTVYDLDRLSECGPGAADLLYQRLAAEGLDAREIDHDNPRLMKDLQRTCSFCADKGQCERDLADGGAGDGWKSYCPNATTIDYLR